MDASPIFNISEEAVKKACECHSDKGVALNACIIAARKLAEENAVEAMTDTHKITFSMGLIMLSSALEKHMK